MPARALNFSDRVILDAILERAVVVLTPPSSDKCISGLEPIPIGLRKPFDKLRTGPSGVLRTLAFAPGERVHG